MYCSAHHHEPVGLSVVFTGLGSLLPRFRPVESARWRVGQVLGNCLRRPCTGTFPTALSNQLAANRENQAQMTFVAFSASNMALDTIVFAIPVAIYFKPGISRKEFFALFALFSLGAM